MTKTATHPPGASLHLGGQAWAHPDLAPLLRPIDTVHQYPGNPRRGDLPHITSSIRDHGLYAGVAAQTSTGHICIGNHRQLALLGLGATQIPVTDLAVDDTQAATIVARDNRTSDQGTYEDVALLDLLTTLAAQDVSPLLLGFPESELEILRRRVEAEDVFTVGTDHMIDEFREISGNDPAGYAPEYARKTVVYLRDQAAIDDFCSRLGITDPLTKDLNYPLGWTPDDRRKLGSVGSGEHGA